MSSLWKLSQWLKLAESAGSSGSVALCEAMKRSAAKDALAKARARVKSKAKSKAKRATKSQAKQFKLKVLYMSGASLVELRALATWTMADLEKKVKEEMAHLKCDGRLKKLIDPRSDPKKLKAGKTLGKLGFSDGAEVHAVLRQPNDSSSELYDGYSSDYSGSDYSDTDPSDLTPLGSSDDDCCISDDDRCIHDGCPNRGCDYYGGECRDCYDEH